ncbi:MAG: ArsR family transcriptional regulator [Cellulophaga sp.]
MENKLDFVLECNAEQIASCKELAKELDTSFDLFSTILTPTENHIRLKILYFLNQENELSNADLSEILEMQVSILELHLNGLVESGFLFSKMKSKILFYYINEEKSKELSPFFRILRKNKNLSFKN